MPDPGQVIRFTDLSPSQRESLIEDLRAEFAKAGVDDTLLDMKIAEAQGIVGRSHTGQPFCDFHVFHDSYICTAPVYF